MKWHILLLLVLLPTVAALEVNHMPFLSEFATNGSTTNAVGNFVNETFTIQPPTNEVWHISRLILQLSDAGQINYDAYGSGISLTNGIIIDAVQNGTVTNITSQAVTKNGDWAAYMYDLSYSDFQTGDNYFTGRWTFTKAGPYIRLNGATNDTIRIHLNDNYGGLESQAFNFQGHVWNSTLTTSTSSEEKRMLSIAAILLMSIFLILLVVTTVLVKSKMVRFLLLIPINLLVVAMIQLLILFIQSADSSLTGIVSILNSFYYIAVLLLIPVIFLSLWALVKNMTTDIFNRRKKKDLEWDKW